MSDEDDEDGSPGEEEEEDGEGRDPFPGRTAVIPIMTSPIFPGMIAPIILSQEKFTPELDAHLRRSGYIGLNLVKQDLKDAAGKAIPEGEMDLENREIGEKDIYRVGVLCKVVKKLKLPDGSVNVLVHGVKRYRITRFLREAPLIEVDMEVFDDILEPDEELDAYTRSVINQVKRLSEINPYFNEEMKLAMLNSPSSGTLADLVAFAISLDIPEAQDFLETLVVKKRFGKLLVYLKREKDVADIQKKISDEVNDKVNKYQREYFLREQLKVIRTELGMDDTDKSRDIGKLSEKLEAMDLPEEARKASKEELERLEVIPDTSPEYNVARTYLNWLIALPWDKSTDDKVDLKHARRILERDHYGLEKAKERILEFLAVRMLKPDYDGTILCLVGPPGVGKTSLGKSIAASLGRKFYRFSLGGMRDEAEIKGHRRTYVGAMPGRILQALKRVEVNNPVIMLDEVDKLGHSYQGDPASALLEVLDPEQNQNFIDHYLDIPFDLSRVLFISTANYIDEVLEPLLDRMETIELSGYSQEEKVSIARKWIVPKQLKRHGLAPREFALSVPTVKRLIADYAREAGVRTLEQTIAKLCRKAAMEKVSSKRSRRFAPGPGDLEGYLGSPKYQSERAKGGLQPGVVTGLAWTAHGGEILFIETLPVRGKGGFRLTGQLGDVMNESANIAYSLVRKILQKRIPPSPPREDEDGTKRLEGEDFLSTHEIHLHLPAGATPKDGPSAGITMATALYGLAERRRAPKSMAMTGELSLTGRVLPVGGVKEKVLAAKRAGVVDVVLPKANEKDLKEVPERHRKGVRFHPVERFDQVLDLAFRSR